jgi:arginyl-tRNA synthetase
MPDARTIADHIGSLVEQAVAAAVAAGELPDIPSPGVAIERPKDAAKGDFASTLPLRMARSAMRPPLEIARVIASHVAADPSIRAPVVAAPGFVNFTLSDSFVQSQVNRTIEAGAAFANLTTNAGKRAQVEFVSANPTGPLHVGNGRGAAIGDALASVLAATGYEVEREYYINDAGTQTDAFAGTLYARYQQLFGRDVPLPADGYPGLYMVELAQALKDEAGDTLLREAGEPSPPELHALGSELMVRQIRATLNAFGVRYDHWFSERELYAPEGMYQKAMAILDERGYLADREGARWFTSADLGESKDNVVVRSDGRPTYYASDIAYHYAKFFERGFSLVVDVWGADHHGHVSRLKTAVGALGGNPEALHILLYQLVTLKRGSEAMRLSKRGGEIITLDELIEEVGADAARFFYLQRSAGAQMDFDLDLAVRQSSENPVYYVQYAHARLSAILERASEQGIDDSAGDVALLTEPHELALIREMMKLPSVIEACAAELEVHPLPHYAMELATAFHAFNDAFRQRSDSDLKVLTGDLDLTRARLRLVRAARISLARVLDLMGMSAPERM